MKKAVVRYSTRTLLLVLFCLLSALSSMGWAAGLPLPAAGQGQFIPYVPVAVPAAGADALTSKPLGFGTAAAGGATLSPRVKVDFAGSIDMYVGLAATIAPGEFYILGADATFRPISEGLQPWRQGVASIDAPLFSDIPVTLLPAGTYDLYLMAVPHGADLDGAFPYYLWDTALVMTPSSLSLSTTHMDFGQISATATQDLTLTNPSSGSDDIAVSLNDAPGIFSITFNTCPPVLGSGQSCTVTVSANPAAGLPGGLHLADISISLSQAGSPLVITMPVIVMPVAPGACTYTLSPSSATLGGGSGSGQFAVTPGSSCPAAGPSLTTDAGWLHVTSSTKTTTGYNIGFTVDANSTGAARAGTITVGGTKQFSVTQGVPPPLPCTYALSTASASFSAAGGQGSFTVSVSGSNCSWTPTSSDGSWLTIDSPSTAQTTSASVAFTVAANTGVNALERSGYISIGNKNFSVYQVGNCPDCVGEPVRYESLEGQWNAPKYFSFSAVYAGGIPPDNGRPVKFLKITVPPEGCPTNRIEFWLSGMSQNGNMLVAGPDNEFVSIYSAWAVYNQKMDLPQGSYEFGPDYWFHFKTLSANETLVVSNGNEQYKGRTFYIMVVNEGPGGTVYRVAAYCF